jgi:hypothetical protein
MGDGYRDGVLPPGIDIKFMDVEDDGNDVIEFVVRFGADSVGRLSIYRPFDGSLSIFQSSWEITPNGYRPITIIPRGVPDVPSVGGVHCAIRLRNS